MPSLTTRPQSFLFLISLLALRLSLNTHQLPLQLLSSPGLQLATLLVLLAVPREPAAGVELG